MFNLGENQGEKQFRVSEAKLINHTSIPNLSIMPKDHKEPDPVTGDPATRPVCGASVSPNGELSHYCSDIMDAASDCMVTKEVVSSEDILAKVDKLNEVLKNKETPEHGFFVGSLDVKALYPSLDTGSKKWCEI